MSDVCASLWLRGVRDAGVASIQLVSQRKEGVGSSRVRVCLIPPTPWRELAGDRVQDLPQALTAACALPTASMALPRHSTVTCWVGSVGLPVRAGVSLAIEVGSGTAVGEVAGCCCGVARWGPPRRRSREQRCGRRASVFAGTALSATPALSRPSRALARPGAARIPERPFEQ